MRVVRYSSLTVALLAPFLVVLIVGSVTSGPAEEAKIRRIKVLEDDRYVENWELARYVQDKDPRIRVAAVRALGRIARPEVKSSLLQALEDPDLDVRAAAAFALGQLGDSTLVSVLLRTLEDPIHGVRKNVVEALGKLGNPGTTPALVGLLESQSPDLRGEAALALARVKDRRATSALVDLMEGDPDDEVRWRAAYAVAATEDPEAMEALARAVSDRRPLVAMYAARGIGKFGSEADWRALRPALAHEDWRVQVDALIAMDSVLDTTSVPALLPLLESPNPHVRATACVVLGDLLHPSASDALRERLKDPNPAVRANAVLAVAKVDEHAALPLVAELTEDPSRYVRARAYEAMGEIQWARSFELLKVGIEDADPAIRAAAISALPKLKQKGVLEALARGLEDTDWVVVAVAAEALGEFGNRAAVGELGDAYWNFPERGGEDVRLAIVKAIHELGGRGARRVLLDALRDPDYRVRVEAQAALRERLGMASEIDPPVYGDGSRDGKDLPLALGTRRVRIKTIRGTIEAVLYGDDAPQTVANFLRLAGDGFYDGNVFHRVVPNFVIQGGCPRGDGWGGPGYTIRCEINEHRYLTGTLGMALAGKDTGGSQFFITHSPQPRLDGNYTVFGQLVSGQDVVDQIMPGDEILSIEEI